MHSQALADHCLDVIDIASSFTLREGHRSRAQLAIGLSEKRPPPARPEEWRLALAEVRLAIARLPPDQRTVLLLVSAEGVAYREAADILGLPIDTVVSGLARARLALGRVLEEPRGGSEPKDGKLC
jgi:RNA polymerase sigma-70 factor (ECF subfamily)